MKIHHVGVAVDDMDEAIRLYTSTFGAEVTHRTTSEQDGLEAAFLRAGDSEVELLRPLREDTPVGKFLARRGPGLHHLAVAVEDIDQALADAREQGLELIDETPRVGLHGSRIAFVHPRSFGGVLTELVET
ncbi:MAG TPA: methylmalonyl-CoA epimerase [Candidatus Dormibacteraeota bacterium]|nr:methylmalonyl-CoA epimerase [Candidatus Dormibacteraeota bacterium]